MVIFVQIVVIFIVTTTLVTSPWTLDLTLQGPSIRQVFEEVIVSAKINFGIHEKMDFQFSWDFGDENGTQRTTILKNNGSLSVASHKYGTTGDYIVKVNATWTSSSDLPNPIVVTRQLSTLLSIVEPITELNLRPLLNINGAILLDDKNTTDPVIFEATIGRGSHIQFVFDYGDGHVEENVHGELDIIKGTLFGHGFHVYRKEGSYLITVTAINPLGSLNRSIVEPFIVQALPKGLQIERSSYVTSPNKSIVFTASVHRGFDVTYDWDFGNGVNINNTGAEVSYAYPVSGFYRLVVTVHNRLTRMLHDRAASMRPIMASTRIFVLDLLRGVSVNISLRNRPVFAIGEIVEFIAIVSPVSDVDVGFRAMVYEWSCKIDDDVKERRLGRTNVGRLKHTLIDDGRYSVWVRVNNTVSEIVSAPLSFTVLRPISGASKIQQSNSIVLGESNKFQARFRHGSNVTLRWDFGDGTPPYSTTNIDKIQHLYNRTGEFRVSVRLTNAISQAELTSVVFVVSEPCGKPELKIHGATDIMKIQRNKVLRLEADTTVTSCSASTTVTHTWNVTADVDSSGQLARHFIFIVLHGRMLNLPLTGFPVGKYRASLKVELVGTIVYATASIQFEVLREEDFIWINGGSSRQIGRSETVILVGNSSLQTSPELTVFSWYCRPLAKPNFDCFGNGKFDVKNNNPLSTTSTLTVVAADLDPQFGSFLFIFIARRAHGRFIKADQLIEISPLDKILPLMITCNSCTDDNVALVQDTISLTVQSLQIPSSLIYDWQVWLVHDGKENLPISDHDCVNSDGSTFFLNASAPSINASAELLDSNIVANITSLIFNETEVTADKTVAPSNHDGLGKGVGSSIENPTEGFPGEAGSAPGRSVFNDRFIESYQDVEPVFLSTSGPTVAGRSNEIFEILESRDVFDISRNIYSKEWKLVCLDESDILSGLHQNKFLVRPGVLRIGKTYVFIVSARGHAQEGKVSQIVKMSMGPIDGRCSIMPLIGREYETQFKLFCYEWKMFFGDNDTSETIFYELSYKQSDDHPKILVYYGLGNSFKFVLPAGLGSGEVKLDVVVWHESGSNTLVCSISRTVLPLSELPNSTVKQIISREVFSSPRSNISSLIKWDDFSGAFNRIQVLSFALKNDPVLTTDREQVNYRTRLLKYVFKGKPSTAAEALQLLRAVDEIYRMPRRFLNLEFSLQRSTLKSVRRAARFYWSSKSTCVPFCSQGLRALFDVIESILESLHNSNVANSCQNHNRLLESTVTLFQKTVAAKLSSNVDSVMAPNNFLEHFIARNLSLEAVCTSGPLDLKWLQVRVNDSVEECHCIQALLSHAVYNPLPVNDSSQFYSKMVSVKMSPCDSGVWSKENMGSVSLSIPRTTSAALTFASHHLLPNNLMNVHKITLPTLGDNSLLVLSLHFDQITHSPSTALLLLSHQYPPSFENCIFRQRVWISSRTFVVSFLAHQLEGRNTYYVGIVDVASIVPSSRSKIFSQIDYSIEVQIIECLQWNPILNSWNESGSHMESFSSNDHGGVRCRFDKLTSYTTIFRSLETIKTVTTLDHMIKLSQNFFMPVVLALILVICLATLTLSSCNSNGFGNYTTHRCGEIYLADNLSTDRYFYKVTLKTGHYSASCTTAKVYIILHGVNGITEPRELMSDAPGTFQLGSSNTFILTAPSDLGLIFKVQIWHDNSGSNPSWFLNHVIVLCVTSGQKIIFQCHKWLAVDKDDGKIERELVLDEDGQTFTRLFLSLFWSLWDYTSWPLIFEHHDSGHFTHYDRMLSILLTVVMTSTLSAVWCLRNSTPFFGFFENLQPSFHFLKVSLCFALIGFFTRLIFVIVFHVSKLPSCCTVTNEKITSGEEFKLSMEKWKSYETAESDILTFNEPIEKFNKLQNWAERQWIKSMAQIYSGLNSPFISSDSLVSNVPTISKRSTLIIDGDRGSCFMFPASLRYFVYILVIFTVIVASIISIMIGIKFSSELGYVWLQFVFLSIVIDVSVLGTIVNVSGAFILSVLSSITKKTFDLQSNRSCNIRDQANEKWGADSSSEDNFKRQFLARQRSREVRFARPPTEKQLLEYKKSALKSMEMKIYLKEFVTSIFVLVILAANIFSRDNATVYELNRRLDVAITRGKLMSFYDVHSTTKWFQWIEYEFLDIIYRTSDDGTNLYVRGTTSVVVGPIKLFRLKCTNNSNSNDQLNLPKNRTKFQDFISGLQNDERVSNETQQIVLEFVLYNIPTKIFSSVNLNVRISSGYSTATIDSALISAENWPLNIISSMSKVILLSWLLWRSSNFAQRYILGSHYLLTGWNAFHVAFLFTLVLYFVAFYCLQVISQRIFVNFVNSGHREISSALFLKQICAVLLGIAMSLHISSSLSLLRVFRSFNYLAHFIRTFYKPLAVTFISIGVPMIGFSCFGSLSFGHQGNADFQTPFTSIEFLFKILVGCIRFDGSTEVVSIYAFLFVVIITVIFIDQAKVMVLSSISLCPPVCDFTITELFSLIVKWIFTFNRRSHFSDLNDNSPRISVEFILAELESQVEVMHKMAMKLLTTNSDGVEDDPLDDFHVSLPEFTVTNTEQIEYSIQPSIHSQPLNFADDVGLSDESESNANSNVDDYGHVDADCAAQSLPFDVICIEDDVNVNTFVLDEDEETIERGSMRRSSMAQTTRKIRRTKTRGKRCSDGMY